MPVSVRGGGVRSECPADTKPGFQAGAEMVKVQAGWR